MSEHHIYFNAFNIISQIGSVRFRKILNFFPDLKTAWHAPAGDLKQAGLEDQTVAAILERRPQINPEAELSKLEKQHITLLAFPDAEYPKILKEIPNPPMVLYILGDLTAKDEMSVAVVGTRKFSPYGKQVAEDLVRDLVRANITVVSGLALGIDALAHRAAIEYQGRTVAVLGCGLDAIYPASNRSIAQGIIQGRGAVISEHPLGTPPLKHHFPYRNRIISGLSLGTVVIEAAADSGALITAEHALEQNRQVFAVPGSIYNPVSIGPNNLLKMGAKLVTSAADILEDLNLGFMQQQLLVEEVVGDNEQEQKVLNILTRQPKHFNEIAKSAGLPASATAATLTIMEMKGKVRNLGANQYVKSR